MNNREQQEIQRLTKEAASNIEAKKPIPAIRALDQIAKITIPEWWYFFYKALWLWDMSTPDSQKQAMDTINEGIGTISDSPLLLTLKAEFLLRLNQVDYALICINEAEVVYDVNETITKQQIENAPPAIENIEQTLRIRYDFKIYITSLRNEARLIQNSVPLYNKIQEIDNRIIQERIRTIELLGVFSAVIALVILSGEFAIKIPSSKQALILIGGLGIVLLAFVTSLSYLLDNSRFGWRQRLLDYRIIIFTLAILLFIQIFNLSQ